MNPWNLQQTLDQIDEVAKAYQDEWDAYESLGKEYDDSPDFPPSQNIIDLTKKFVADIHLNFGDQLIKPYFGFGCNGDASVYWTAPFRFKELRFDLLSDTTYASYLYKGQFSLGFEQLALQGGSRYNVLPLVPVWIDFLKGKYDLPWLGRAINYLETCHEPFLQYGFKPISEENKEWARNLMTRVQQVKDRPVIIPYIQGGLQLRWAVTDPNCPHKVYSERDAFSPQDVLIRNGEVICKENPNPRYSKAYNHINPSLHELPMTEDEWVADVLTNSELLLASNSLETSGHGYPPKT